MLVARCLFDIQFTSRNYSKFLHKLNLLQISRKKIYSYYKTVLSFLKEFFGEFILNIKIPVGLALAHTRQTTQMFNKTIGKHVKTTRGFEIGINCVVLFL